MCYDDFEGTDVASQWRRARKAHACEACHDGIRKGDRYHRTVQIYDGTPSVFKHCARCWALANEIIKVNGTCQWDLNCGTEWEQEHGPLPEHVARLAFMTPDEAQALSIEDVLV